MNVFNIVISSILLFFVIHMKASDKPIQDRVFVPYVEELCVSLTERGHSCRLIETVSIRKSSLPKKHAGAYHPLSHDILISKELWATSSDEVKEQLIYHELGHSLGLDHSEYGIMQSSGFINDRFYKQHRAIFIKEMLDELVLRPREKTLTKAEILDNEHAVVRFTATWCPPCKALAPIFDEVAAENPSVKTYVVDVDQNQDLARDMGIRGIPALVKIKDKKVDQVMVGAQPKEKVKELFVK